VKIYLKDDLQPGLKQDRILELNQRINDLLREIHERDEIIERLKGQLARFMEN